jgi:hypothetical protein
VVSSSHSSMNGISKMRSVRKKNFMTDFMYFTFTVMNALKQAA